MMTRDKHLPLTETTFYTLLALRQPAHGYVIMQQVKALSGGEVDMAAGTMYGALENLQKQGLIHLVGLTEGRRKTYHITPYGTQVLDEDINRLHHMIEAATVQGASNVQN